MAIWPKSLLQHAWSFMCRICHIGKHTFPLIISSSIFIGIGLQGLGSPLGNIASLFHLCCKSIYLYMGSNWVWRKEVCITLRGDHHFAYKNEIIEVGCVPQDGPCDQQYKVLFKRWSHEPCSNLCKISWVTERLGNFLHATSCSNIPIKYQYCHVCTQPS